MNTSASRESVAEHSTGSGPGDDRPGVGDSADLDAGWWSRAARLTHLLPRRILIFVIELYRTWISPMRLPTCRFEPTCSGYAVEALDRHGFLYGGLLAVVRLLKCGPWHKPGYDPVPETGPRFLVGRNGNEG